MGDWLRTRVGAVQAIFRWDDPLPAGIVVPSTVYCKQPYESSGRSRHAVRMHGNGFYGNYASGLIKGGRTGHGARARHSHPQDLDGLGKAAALRDSRNLLFASILRAPVKVPNESYDFDLKHPGIPTPMFANDEYGDCVIAGRAHQTLRSEDGAARARHHEQ